MTQREEFEAWADANWAYIDLIEDAWMIWQAAQAAQPAQILDNPCLNDYVDKTIRAHMAKLEANGYRLVPVEPTQEMMGYGAGAGGERLNLCMNDAAEIYRAMIAVAPSAAPSKENGNG